MSWDDNYTKMAKMDTFFVVSAYIIGASVDITILIIAYFCMIH